MYAQAVIKPNLLLRNGAYGIVMRGVQKCTCIEEHVNAIVTKLNKNDDSVVEKTKLTIVLKQNDINLELPNDYVTSWYQSLLDYEVFKNQNNNDDINNNIIEFKKVLARLVKEHIENRLTKFKLNDIDKEKEVGKEIATNLGNEQLLTEE